MDPWHPRYPTGSPTWCWLDVLETMSVETSELRSRPGHPKFRCRSSQVLFPNTSWNAHSEHLLGSRCNEYSPMLITFRLLGSSRESGKGSSTFVPLHTETSRNETSLFPDCWSGEQPSLGWSPGVPDQGACEQLRTVDTSKSYFLFSVPSSALWYSFKSWEIALQFLT